MTLRTARDFSMLILESLRCTHAKRETKVFISSIEMTPCLFELTRNV